MRERKEMRCYRNARKKAKSKAKAVTEKSNMRERKETNISHPITPRPEKNLKLLPKCDVKSLDEGSNIHNIIELISSSVTKMRCQIS